MQRILIDDLRNIFSGKRVAIIGSGPSMFDNTMEHIDGHDIIIRVNNYKMRGYEDKVGSRCDYHYSFYGSSIKKTSKELRQDGIKGHLCKCPNDICHMTEWHEKNGKQNGCRFEWIYKNRQDFWIAPVYIPETRHYLQLFNKLNRHVPTTGFACIWEIMNLNPKELYITGFDFFVSKIHNGNEPWRSRNTDDPIKHLPLVEKHIFTRWAKENKYIKLDDYLKEIICQS